MKDILSYTIVLICALALLNGHVAYGQAAELDREREKRGQTGMQFLSISMSPRAAALADAMAAVDQGSSAAMFYNPATMASLDGGHLSLGTVGWIADIRYNGASFALSPAGGNYGVFGVSVVSIDYGDLEGTVRADNESGYIDTGDFSPNAFAVGLGYARTVTDRFSVGGDVRYVRQDLGASTMSRDNGSEQDNAVGTAVFDFGVLYNTGFQSLNLAMMARNFSPAVTYEEEAFETPLMLSIGASLNMTEVVAASMSGSHDFLLAVEAGHPRSFAEQYRIGGEYRFMNMLALRAGYVYPADEQSLSLGAGLNLNVSGLRFGADYSYSQFGIFDNVNRLGVEIGF